MYERQYNEQRAIIGREEFQPKERPRPTIPMQIAFNYERLMLLEKTLRELSDKLNPLMITSALNSAEIGKDIQRPPCSELFNSLENQSNQINAMIQYVESMNRDIQL